MSSDALSFLACVLVFFVNDDLSLSSSFFFLRTGDSCVCDLDGLRRGGGVVFLPFVIVYTTKLVFNRICNRCRCGGWAESS